MATYKVLQDIEAEDKLFGPFTLKQFIFAGIAIGIGFLSFRILITGIPMFVKVPFIILFLPFFIVFAFLAAPIGQDQPNDVWLFARLRFLFKPRVRIWNQDGISELVTITAPKKIEAILTKDFTQDEVRSRLQALANTVDTRGWAVKNVNASMFGTAGYLSSASSDRLVDPNLFPQEVSNVDVLPSDDMFDPSSSPTAQHFDQLLRQSSGQRLEQARSQMHGQVPAQAPQEAAQNYWFMNQPAAPQTPLPEDYATFDSQHVVSPGAANGQIDTQETAEEKALAEKLLADKEKERQHTNAHMRVLQPLHDREGKPIPRPPLEPQSVPETDQPLPAPKPTQSTINPAILGLANNDDLDVATIARQAKKINQPNDDGEVVISLHK